MAFSGYSPLREDLMKKCIVAGSLLFLSLSGVAENRLVINGFDQISVQGALALEDLKNTLLAKDWKKESLEVMAESLELVRIGEAMTREAALLNKKTITSLSLSEPQLPGGRPTLANSSFGQALLDPVED
jgi:hypothetical protein